MDHSLRQHKANQRNMIFPHTQTPHKKHDDLDIVFLGQRVFTPMTEWIPEKSSSVEGNSLGYMSPAAQSCLHLTVILSSDCWLCT